MSHMNSVLNLWSKSSNPGTSFSGVTGVTKVRGVIEIFVAFDKRGTHTNWVIPAGLGGFIFRNARWFQGLDAILDWLAGWLHGTNGLDLT